MPWSKRHQILGAHYWRDLICAAKYLELYNLHLGLIRSLARMALRALFLSPIHHNAQRWSIKRRQQHFTLSLSLYIYFLLRSGMCTYHACMYVTMYLQLVLKKSQLNELKIAKLNIWISAVFIRIRVGVSMDKPLPWTSSPSTGVSINNIWLYRLIDIYSFPFYGNRLWLIPNIYIK